MYYMNIIIVILGIFVAQVTYSQKETEFGLGLKYGYGFGRISVSPKSDSFKSANSFFNFGLTSEIGLSNHLSIMIDFYSSMKSFKHRFQGTNTLGMFGGGFNPNTENFDLVYLFGLSTIIRYRLTQNSINPYILGGPSVNSVYLPVSNNVSEAHYLDYLSLFDFNLAMGLGVEFNFKNDKLCLDARYIKGLTSIFDDGKNRVVMDYFSPNISYIWNLKF